MTCSYCGSPQHSIDYCPKTWNGQGNLNARCCGYCGSREHWTAGCPKTWQGQINRGECEWTGKNPNEVK